MPLSVPLVLDPGYVPGRCYTVHVHRVRWNVLTWGTCGLTALEAQAREGVRVVADCVVAGVAEEDITVQEHPDGSKDAVARVLCDSETCAAVAERYRRDADEEIEAEAARVWASGQLPGQDVQLFRRPAELAQPVPADTVSSAADMLAAVLAVQQQRTGGSTDRVVLMMDEVAYLARESGLLSDGTPEDARAAIDRLIRTSRRPYPSEPDRTTPVAHRLTDLEGGAEA